MMEHQIKEYFDSVTMPESCRQRIEDAMQARSARAPHPRWVRTALTAAAALLFVLGILHSDTIAATAQNFYDYVIHALNPKSPTIGEVEDGVIVSYGGVNATIGQDSNSMTASMQIGADLPAEVRDGRLYFTANGENIDITDLCSMDTAYIYTVKDATGLLHHIVVGGTPENWGYQVFVQDPSCENGDPTGWIAGASGRHKGADSDWKPYAWVFNAKEILDYPWSP